MAGSDDGARRRARRSRPARARRTRCSSRWTSTACSRPLVDDPATSPGHARGGRCCAGSPAADGVALALVSGRALADLAAVAEVPDGTLLVGGHGAEPARGATARCDPRGPTLDRRRSPATRPGRRRLSRPRSAGTSGRVEVKPTTAVLHTRRRHPHGRRPAHRRGRRRWASGTGRDVMRRQGRGRAVRADGDQGRRARRAARASSARRACCSPATTSPTSARSRPCARRRRRQGRRRGRRPPRSGSPGPDDVAESLHRLADLLGAGSTARAGPRPCRRAGPCGRMTASPSASARGPARPPVLYSDRPARTCRWRDEHMATVTFDKATRIYPGTERPAVDSLDLQIEDGEFLVLVGPSGCGKSTSLRMLAGLEDVNAGRILIGDRDVTDVQPKDRDIAMVFQNYALYPHMSVADNMGFALKIAGTPEGRDPPAGRGGRDDPRPQRVPGPQAQGALRWPAPARRDGPRDRAPAPGVPDGRAAVEPRRQAPRLRRAPRSPRCSAGSASPRSTSRTTRPRP